MKTLKKSILGLLTLTFTIILFACSENTMQQKEIDDFGKGPDYSPVLYPPDRYYTEDHVWVKLESEDIALVGITSYPLSSIGTVLAVTDPEDETIKGKTGIPPKKIVQNIEGSLSTFYLRMPVYGDIIIKNPELDINPSIINVDPYETGWILKIANFDMQDVLNLMNSDEYASYVAGL